MYVLCLFLVHTYSLQNIKWFRLPEPQYSIFYWSRDLLPYICIDNNDLIKLLILPFNIYIPIGLI